jgi:pseudouridine synthase
VHSTSKTRTSSAGRVTSSVALPRQRRAVDARPALKAPGLERLQKILSHAGIAARRAAEELISEGRVQVNGKVVTELGSKADLRKDRIVVDGQPLQAPGPLRYVILHKPIGVVTTASDPEGRPTVVELMPRRYGRLFPVGRLDYHTSGLLLLTNDGVLAMRLAHPRYGVEKTYRAKVRGVPSKDVLISIGGGVQLDDGRTAPAGVRLLRTVGEKAWLEITLREGRRREVRRICERVGFPVEKLRRIQLGPLALGTLPIGTCRQLTVREVVALRRAAGLPEE